MAYLLRHHRRIASGLPSRLIGESREVVVGELGSDFGLGLERRRIGQHLNVIEIAITKCNKKGTIKRIMVKLTYYDYLKGMVLRRMIGILW